MGGSFTGFCISLLGEPVGSEFASVEGDAGGRVVNGFDGGRRRLVSLSLRAKSTTSRRSGERSYIRGNP